MKKLIVSLGHLAHIAAPITEVVDCEPIEISETLKFDICCGIYRANQNISKSRENYRKMVKK